MRVIVAVGARPNVVKVGPLLPAMRDAGFDVQVAYTGSKTPSSHGALTDPAFYGVDLIEPTWFLDIGTGTQAMQAGSAMVAFEELFSSERPDAVMVVGDVSPTLAAAVSAAKAGISVVHLEAGLRCGDLTVPEEVNRVLVSRVSAMHLTPTEAALETLEDEGVEPERIHFVGSMMAESVIRHLDDVRRIDPSVDFGIEAKHFILGSFHRPENLDAPERLSGIIGGLAAAGMSVILPDTNGLSAALDRYQLVLPNNVRLVGGAPYRTMLALERDAAVVITDSAGVQEESCIIGTPCLTVRDCSEQVETILAGANELIAADADAIASRLREVPTERRNWVVPKRWDRAVSDRVVRALKRGISPLS